MRYPEWPRALVLSQRALGAWAGEGESCRDQAARDQTRGRGANLGDIREMCPSDTGYKKIETNGTVLQIFLVRF